MRLIKFAAILLLTISFKVGIGVADDPTEAPKRKCYLCDSSNENCLKDLSKLNPDECKDGEQFCSTKLDSGKITRGCLKTETDCTGDNCKSCKEDGCNNHNVCQNCDSAKDSKCVKLSTTDTSLYEICEKKDTKCLINITNDKTTVRRCAKEEDTKSCTNEATCHLCDDANCNNFIFPKNRLRCFQCKSGTDGCSNVESSESKIASEPCSLYVETEKCFMYGESETKINRGCVSDVGEENKCKTDSQDKSCYICDTDNCNHYAYKRKQNIQCIQCESSKENTKCMWGFSENEAMDCKNQIEYLKEDACYTEIKDDQVHRGCLYDRAEGSGECKGDNCTICTNKSGCNNKDQNVFSCIRCRSDEDKKCYDDATNATNLDGGKCRNAVTDKTNTCYRGIWNGVVIRGCWVDADVRVQATCNLNDRNKCEICHEPNCNNMKTTKDGAARLSGIFGLISILLAFLIQLL